VSEVWAAATWTVRAGREEEFIEAWREFAEWSAAAHGPARAWLLRDREDVRRFVSIGPWPSEDAIVAWRDDPGFGERIRPIRELLEALEPRTLDPMVAVET
jgi:heme-degrading monooxygenase HmoA